MGEWVQCDKPECRKWRRVAWNVDIDSLPEEWQCADNYWDPENATCDAPEDGYDPGRESTLGFDSTGVELIEFGLNTWRDVFCLRNQIFYEAQVKGEKEVDDEKSGGDKIKKILFHFKGWPKNFDEWIEVGSDRIAPHNMHTTSTKSRNPQAQEKLLLKKGFNIHGKPIKKSKLNKVRKNQKNGNARTSGSGAKRGPK